MLSDGGAQTGAKSTAGSPPDLVAQSSSTYVVIVIAAVDTVDSRCFTQVVSRGLVHRPCDICSSTFDFGTGDASYSLRLTSFLNGSPATTVFSDTNARFTSTDGGILISFDDNGAGPDLDFNDFRLTVPVTTTTTVPEPTALAGLGLVAGALAFSRRRKSNKAV